MTASSGASQARAWNPAVGIAALLVFAFAIYAGWQVRNAIADARALHDVGVTGASLGGDIEYYMQESRRTVIYALTSKDPNVQLPYVDEARRADAQVKLVMNELRRLALDEGLRDERVGGFQHK